jgi:hypothetical protein
MKTILAALLSTLSVAGMLAAQSGSNSSRTPIPATTVTSIVGTWYGFVAWGCDSAPIQDDYTTWTFNSDGSWTYIAGGGRWIQVEGMVAWTFTDTPGLVYTANVTRNAINGMMGYAHAAPNPGTGCFFAVRGQPPAAAVPAGQNTTTGAQK